MFPGFAVPHIENSILKSTMASLWEIEYDILNKTCLKKFRDDTQVSQNIYMWYQIASGNFKERSQNFGQFFTVNDANLIKNKMTKHKYKSICINDSILNGDFETTKSIVHSAFDQILPDKSTFEL